MAVSFLFNFSSAVSDVATVEGSLSMEPFYDEVLRNEDKCNLRIPQSCWWTTMKLLLQKQSGIFMFKYSFFHFCHMLMYAAYN
jgi:hypothetical protein